METPFIKCDRKPAGRCRRQNGLPCIYTRSDTATGPPPASAEVSFRTRGGRASFTWDILQDTELSGPMVLHLSVEARGLQDLFLLWRAQAAAGKEVFFEGSYGFGCDMGH